MASRNLTVVAQVKDAATTSLNRIAAGFDKTNKSIKTSSANFTEFNRVMFSATAFIGMFSNGLRKIGDTLDQAGTFDRISTQFEKVMGPRGQFFQQISSFSKNSIDRVEAMKAAISLSTLGIVKDSGRMAEMFARAGSAAKHAGLQSGEGIQKFSKFLKDGQVEHLSFLNVLSATNPQLQTQMAILNKAGGVMGNVLSTQQRLRMGTAALRAVTKDMASDEADLVDVMSELRQSMAFMRNEFGSFLGKALTPMIQKITDAAFSLSDLIKRIRLNDPWLIKMGKNLIFVTTAITGTVAALGALRLAMKALGALGLGGIPLVTTALVGLVVAMQDGEDMMTTFSDAAKKLGMSLLGISQLTSSFLMDSDNFSKGIGKMDKAVYDFLKEKGLLDIITQIARVTSVTLSFARDVGGTLIDWGRKTEAAISGVIQKLEELFGLGNKSSWSRGLVEGMGGIRGILVKVAAAGLVVKGLSPLLSPLGKVFSKTKGISSIVGAATGSLGKKPLGTISDPIYVKIVQDIFGPFQKAKSATFDPNKTIPGGPAAILAANKTFLSSMISTLGTIGRTILGTLRPILAPLAGAFAALSAIGAVKGIIAGVSGSGGFSTLFSSLGNLGGALLNSVSIFMETTPILKVIKDNFMSFAGFLGSLPGIIINRISKGYEVISGTASHFVNKGANYLSNLLNTSSAESIMASEEFQKRPMSDFGVGLKDDFKTYGITKVPTMPESTAHQQALATRAASMLESQGALGEAKRLRTTMEMALQDGKIDPEEWANMFKVAVRQAVDESELNKNVKDSKPKAPITRSTRC